LGTPYALEDQIMIVRKSVAGVALALMIGLAWPLGPSAAATEIRDELIARGPVQLYMTPQAGATKALLRMGRVALTGGSAYGTYIGANPATGFAGDFINLMVNGTSKFKVTYTGVVTATSFSPGVTTFADGTAAAPSIANTTDTNTGIYWSAADTLGLTAGGTARATLSTTAMTLIGTVDFTAVGGNITATGGNIAATAGSVSAGTTITSGTGLHATAGGVTADAGNIVATLGNVTASAGNIAATLGSVAAGTTVTAGASVAATTTVTGGTGVIATTGNVTATAGNLVGKRLLGGGTALASGDIALGGGGAGWGSNATKAITGTDLGGIITITTSASDTPAASPTIVLTFKDGTFGAAPYVVASWSSTSTGPVQQWLTTSAATTATFVYNGTPSATTALTYKLNFIVVK
jgi:hypothetical protein